MSKVVTLPAKRHDLQDLVEKIKEAIYAHEGRQFTLLEGIGALEVAKLELFQEVIRIAEEEEE